MGQITMEQKKYTLDVNGRTLQAEFGSLAQQANGSVVVRYGETVVLATATMSSGRREGMTFFPLFVEYEERFYAAGKIKGSRFIKREGRPSDKATLSCRIIDRTIRPLFDERMRNEIQVVATILSIDKENDPVVASIMAASLALGVSDIPWNGPVSAVRACKNSNELVINPLESDSVDSPVDLLVSGTIDKVNMIEANASEISNEEMQEAIIQSAVTITKFNEFQNAIIQEIGKDKQKIELTTPPEEFEKEVRSFLSDNGLEQAFYTKDKQQQEEKMDNIKFELNEMLEEKYSKEESPQKKEEALLVYEQFLNDILHNRILEKEERPDGRGLTDVRSLLARTGILPRTHGSGLFQRGDTQALTTATLGAPGAQQIIDTMEVDEKKRYIHHYNFPPFSVGEVGFFRGPGRREIGHGALAEKALLPVLPSQEDFPYTMLLVSEILASNGSSSMASTCGSTLALMDAGVPIKKPVAGIAMGIIMNKDGNYKILSDIQGPEDHWGDMDFKVAGTKDGITAMQLDVKIDGITPEIAGKVLQQAFEARMKILDVMTNEISEPRKEHSPYAPRIITIKINPEKIRDVIGPGGKVINGIIDETGAEIDIEDDGTIFITSENQEGATKAQKHIELLTHEVKAGEIYEGKVVRIMDFGAFVEILPGQDGLVHISQLSENRVDKVEDVVKVGQHVKVKVAEIDKMGRTNLTMKGLDG